MTRYDDEEIATMILLEGERPAAGRDEFLSDDYEDDLDDFEVLQSQLLNFEQPEEIDSDCDEDAREEDTSDSYSPVLCEFCDSWAEDTDLKSAEGAWLFFCRECRLAYASWRESVWIFEDPCGTCGERQFVVERNEGWILLCLGCPESTSESPHTTHDLNDPTERESMGMLPVTVPCEAPTVPASAPRIHIHRTLLRRSDFSVPADARLTQEEASIVARYGHWMEALASGVLASFTREQERFVGVTRGDEQPRTVFERAWKKVREARVRAALEDIHKARLVATAVRAEYDLKREAIVDLVRPALKKLEEECAQRIESTAADVKLLEDEARRLILESCRSCQRGMVQAIYVRGRVTWDGKGLSGYVMEHPEIAQFRRVGRPSVSIRYKPDDQRD